MIDAAISKLAAYALRTGLIQESEYAWAVNTILDVLKLDGYTDPGQDWGDIELAPVLEELLDDAHARGVLAEDSVVYRDLFDTELMGRLTPRPAQVIEKFQTLYREDPQKATDWYYQFSQDTNYIRRDRIAKDMQWKTETEYGELDITINLSKPEKDPKAIAAARNLPASNYPRCQLCAENEGYAGRVNHPARQNHRVVPITINGSPWFLQYSPYVYYNEHCICLNSVHTPMKIDRACFGKLLDFVRQFPHYFVGSNADLPIVGGSILAHDHFQGGRYTFAMERTPIETPFTFRGFEDVEAGIVKWPMSVVRIAGADPDQLVELADRILTAWRGYTDEEAVVYAETDGTPHNTITPIARMRDGKFELDLVLRNNLTTEEHPLGLYHPHAELHHIKKENIGLIEVMGLAVLPARLKEELAAVADALVTGADLRASELTEKHADWAEAFRSKYDITRDNALDVVQKETGLVFAKVLEHAGVYKRNAEGKKAFLRFLNTI
ncbi:UDP-glucose--hexose-1-phosphate uridylyltransferase [Pseudoflavonifractor phocaeensis]|uniref:UDP-glucose--hexose-1-phosphate uridylyltransferase n=1 Tax=Pseudoflavonifractor phocaeensis TaxID=1870988 RepID=UPI001F175014|nr:UDP-glucose--hexose-1-phosphate uridylyltransferase [Pseudoflavonifractor phocaeensis]MCF2596175.1 UDP-glucose--hexose-1-phosphate uridylyltransferase [Pseudoflavonifractor phocaeensis]